MTRRPALPTTARSSAALCLALAALPLTACGGGGAPDGYEEVSVGPVTVMVPPGLGEPGEVQDVPTAYDIVRQDPAGGGMDEAGAVLLGVSEFRGAMDPSTSEYDADDALEYMVVLDPLGMAHPTLPEPVDVSRGGDTILRQDVPRGPDDEVYYMWAGQDDASGTVSVLVLGGPDVTEEMVRTVDETFEIGGDAA